MLTEPDLLPKGFDWASFPCEETEVLAGKDGFTLANLRRFKADVGRSRAARPQGMVDALTFARSYPRAAVSKGVRPRLLVLTHSSGGRTAVKLLEEFSAQSRHSQA